MVKLTEEDLASMPTVELTTEEWMLILALALSGKSLEEIKPIIQNYFEYRFNKWKASRGY